MMEENKLTDEEIIKGLYRQKTALLEKQKRTGYAPDTQLVYVKGDAVIKILDIIQRLQSEKKELEDLCNKTYNDLTKEIERLTEEKWEVQDDLDNYHAMLQESEKKNYELQKQVDELKFDKEILQKLINKREKDTAKEILQGFNKWLKQAISDSYEIAVLNSGGFHGGRNRAFHEVKELVKKVAESKGVEVE